MLFRDRLFALSRFQLWVDLRHPSVLRASLKNLSQVMLTSESSEFLGANILDEKPFVVMPVMRNGNENMYIQSHPECNRNEIVCHYFGPKCPMADHALPVASCFSRFEVPTFQKDHSRRSQSGWYRNSRWKYLYIDIDLKF